MSIGDITKEDIQIVNKFIGQVVSKMDNSTFNFSLQIIEEIINKLDLDMSISHPVNHENIKIKFDDILFSSKL